MKIAAGRVIAISRLLPKKQATNAVVQDDDLSFDLGFSFGGTARPASSAPPSGAASGAEESIDDIELSVTTMSEDAAASAASLKGAAEAAAASPEDNDASSRFSTSSTLLPRAMSSYEQRDSLQSNDVHSPAEMFLFYFH
jgi:hypothetical protein